MISTVGWGYLPNLGPLRERVEVRAIASRSRQRAEAVAREHDIPHVFDDLDAMLQHDDLDAVINLTPIPAHAETSRRILASGRHLVSEKPLAATVAEADTLIELAASRDLIIICAPARMLEPTRIATKRAVQAGELGHVAFARVRSSHAGPAAQAWPTDPTWFYQEGAGPLLDMGVYGIQEITGILGPAKRVVAFSGITEPERIVAAGPFAGLRIPVGAPDNTLLLLDFGASTFAVVDSTFNVRAARGPALEIFGLRGTLTINDARPDPTTPRVEIYRTDVDGVTGRWSSLETEEFRREQHRSDSLQRAVLIEHLLDCLETGAGPVASAEHARHTLEIMLAAAESAAKGCAVTLHTSF